MSVHKEVLLKALHAHFGFQHFRPQQEEIVEAALSGEDVLAVLPTGAGKSLCFQLPALISEGLTVVCSPLIALMKDQVDQLRVSGISAAYLNQTVSNEEFRQVMRQIMKGELKLLYAAPERLLMEGFLNFLKSANVTRIVVDEAHCVSDWGHDFRPEFRELRKLRAIIPTASWLAVTATATKQVRDDIVETLQFAKHKVVVASFNRKNLFYSVKTKSKPKQQILEFLNGRKGSSGIIYCSSRDSCEELANFLKQSGYSALPYHAGLESSTRSSAQEKFQNDEVDIICATIAFGMGINKPSVRFVVHYDLPKSIEGYYQETGRAGRDGEPSDCLLLFGLGDSHKVRFFIDQIFDDDHRKVAEKHLREVLNFGQSKRCRRQSLLAYFGEAFEGNCGLCDNCVEPKELIDGTTEAQKFLSAVLRTQKTFAKGFGLHHIVNILLGSKAEAINKWRHDQLPTFGQGIGVSKDRWLEIGRDLLEAGFIVQDRSTYATLNISEKGLLALRNREAVFISKPRKITVSGSKSKSGPTVTKTESSDSSEAASQELFEKLRALRRELAKERNVPAFVILGDAALKDMAHKRPQTSEELLNVFGIGESKQRQFGDSFLRVIQNYVGGV